jgi:hypothetical protein
VWGGRENEPTTYLVHAVGVGGSSAGVTQHSELVLVRTGHVELGGQAVAAVAHYLAGGVVGNSRGFRSKVLQLQPLQQAKHSGDSLLLRLGQAQQALADGLGKADGDVTESLHATYATKMKQEKNDVDKLKIQRGLLNIEKYYKLRQSQSKHQK